MELNNKVAVLMPVYNAEKYLQQAIDSILNQTYPDFKLYIINDGSTDDSGRIILSCADPRIQYIKNEENKGLIYTLNRGLQLIQAEYLVRMDADDVALPHRIETQVAFMDAHPDVIISGAQVQCFGAASNKLTYPLTDSIIRANMLLECSFAHPSVIMRLKNIREANLTYDKNYLHIEDHELWLNAMQHGQLANVDEVLLNYRMEGQNITIVNWQSREERIRKIAAKVLQMLEIPVTDAAVRLYLELSNNKPYIKSIKELDAFVQLVRERNAAKHIADPALLEEVIKKFTKKIFFKIIDQHPSEIMSYWARFGGFSFSQLRYMFGSFKARLFKRQRTS